MDERGMARERVDRFLAAFNSIETELRSRLNADRSAGFRELARRFRDRHGFWRRSYELLEPIAQMRNFLVHETVNPALYAAVPSPEVLELIERLRDELVRPEIVGQRFARNVVEFGSDDLLTSALEVVDTQSITQFPIREGDTFVGLLTSNGIAHWLARPNDAGMVELNAPIREVLDLEEERGAVRFVARSTPVEEAFDLFVTTPGLAAVLVTQSGAEHESLLGIITPWDVAAHRG